MEPYYVMMRLPQQGMPAGETAREEFLLMSPLSPIKREDKNILGWMCAALRPGALRRTVALPVPAERFSQRPDADYLAGQFR